MSKNPAFLTYVGLSIMIGLWLAMAAHYGSTVLYHPAELDKPAYPLIAVEEGAQEEQATETAAAPAESTEAPAAEAPSAGGDSAIALLASADTDAGAKVSKKCAACHSFDQGGSAKVGPNLWDIVGKPVASGEFKYSGALAGLGGEWSYDRLDAFLAKPKDFAPGTKMTFAGLKSAEDRANIIAFLRGLSSAPKPLP